MDLTSAYAKVTGHDHVTLEVGTAAVKVCSVWMAGDLRHLSTKKQKARFDSIDLVAT